MKAGFVASDNPCCGVYSTAEATCLPFKTVMAVAAFALQKKASWLGRTTYEDRIKILESLGATYARQYKVEGLTLIEACYLAFEHTGNFIFDLSGHSVALKNGLLIDQYGSYHPVKYSRRYHRINTATKVLPVTDFDEESLWESLIDPLA